jgi:hypothetical protein
MTLFQKSAAAPSGRLGEGRLMSEVSGPPKPHQASNMIESCHIGAWSTEMLKKILIGAMLATIAVSGDASAQQPPAITQQTVTIKRTPLLQKNCGKLAAETFRREPADENRVDYRSHYNLRLNKCFYEETYISPTPVGINMWVYLSDLQDNRIYGGFHMSTNIGLFYCNLLDKECHSEAEWNGLVKPYMEDAVTTGTTLPISAAQGSVSLEVHR